MCNPLRHFIGCRESPYRKIRRIQILVDLFYLGYGGNGNPRRIRERNSCFANTKVRAVSILVVNLSTYPIHPMQYIIYSTKPKPLQHDVHSPHSHSFCLHCFYYKIYLVLSFKQWSRKVYPLWLLRTLFAVSGLWSTIYYRYKTELERQPNSD